MTKKRDLSSIIYLITLLTPVVIGALMFVVAFLIVAIGTMTGKNQNATIGQALGGGLLTGILAAIWWGLIASFVPLVAFTVFFLMQTYQMWNAIDDGKTRATGGKAVGFLFIPFFSLYWIFIAWGGFPTDYNEFVHRHGLQNKVPLLDKTLYTILPILQITSVFLITIPIAWVVFYFLIRKNNQAIHLVQTALAEKNSLGVGQNVLSPQFSQIKNAS